MPGVGISVTLYVGVRHPKVLSVHKWSALSTDRDDWTDAVYSGSLWISHRIWYGEACEKHQCARKIHGTLKIKMLNVKMLLLQGPPHYKHYFNIFDDMLAVKVIPIRSSGFCLKFYKPVSHI